jgi:hypothetical protein
MLCVAQELGVELRGMGLPVVQATSQLAPRLGDIMLMDSCESVS